MPLHAFVAVLITGKALPLSLPVFMHLYIKISLQHKNTGIYNSDYRTRILMRSEMSEDCTSNRWLANLHTRKLFKPVS
jgi:hypothetical protein